MTSEGEARKTSEFLRRRKLRLQQVREQSKDIAKRIRQRAEVEKLKQVVELDAKKEQIFLQRQEKVVKKLEELYLKGLENVGTSHTDATVVTQPVKTDLSRLRGKEAAAELKRKKQEKLNEQKKSLDRKVQAREAANVISREKSTTIANKLSTKSSTSKYSNEEKSATKHASIDKSASNNLSGTLDENKEVSRIDMATQWDSEILPNEWEPNIPCLPILKNDSTKETLSNDTEKQKRLNLFAISDEMPSSLRGTHHNDKESSKPSLTLVSEYIQNRALRLREPEVSKCIKKQSEDLQNLKQTILRTRSSNHQAKPNNAERLYREITSENSLTRKKSVTMYNHSTKDTRDVPFSGESVVIRDTNSDKDAYSEALNEITACNNEKQNKKMQDMMNKIAMTRQNVDKEYKDTMAFLNRLPKSPGLKPNNKTYKDDHRLQLQSENRQRTLQQEFRKVEKESREGVVGEDKSSLPRSQPRKSPSATGDSFNERDFQYSWMPVPESDGNLAVHTIPTAVKEGKAGNSVKFSKVDNYHEYRSRHKHTPPTKDTGSSYSKKVNKRYVEAVIIQKNDDNSLSSSSTDGSIEDLKTDAKENKNTRNDDTIKDLTDAERIIIYKILDHKNKKHDKSSRKMKPIDITLSSIDIDSEEIRRTTRDYTADKTNQQKDNSELARAEKGNALTTNVLREGLYKKNDDENGDNIASMYYESEAQEDDKYMETDQPIKQTPCQYCSHDGCIDHQPLRRHCNKRDDECTSKNEASNLHPSVITSTTSCKTATNIKHRGTQAQSEYVRLVDKGEKDKGNIYIGATGLLRDDAYEVVIQLRKKGITDSEKKEEVIKTPTLDEENEQTGKSTSIEASEIMQMKSKNSQHTAEVIDCPLTLPTNQDPIIVNTSAVTDSVQNNTSLKQPIGSKNTPSTDKITHDKSVSTTFEYTNRVSNYVFGTTPTQRTGTCAYTQTTHESPNPRPMFVHMSSSTSTAYMSPPEVIFPKYFRPGNESSDEAYRNFDQQQPYCKVYSKSRCRRCVGPTKTYFKKIPTMEENKLKTPPNTARSIDTEIEYSFNIDNVKKRCRQSSPVSAYRHHKCKNKGQQKLCCKYKKDQLKVLHKKNIKSSVIYNRNAKTSSNTNKKLSKTYLNPMIKDYINKLLSLNREGMKAIQVINQECSSVNTPAESILNIPSNVHEDKPNDNVLRSSISLEEIKNLIRKQILEDNAISNNLKKSSSSRDSKSGNWIPKHIKTWRRKSKKKKMHKVKNLNISKKIRLTTCHSLSFSERNNMDNHTMFDYSKFRSQSHASSEHIADHREIISRETCSENILNPKHKQSTHKLSRARKSRNRYICDDTSCEGPKTVTSSSSMSPDSHIVSTTRNRSRQPINSSTQTSRTIDNEINFMKLAEDKLQNMEKIANLTEKCTKRLSNLAKVLEEVRKNKSLAYSQISNSDSTDCDQKSERPLIADRIEKQCSNTVFDVKEKTELRCPSTVSKENQDLDSTDYEALLFDIPKAGYIVSPHSDVDDVIDGTKTLPFGMANMDYRINNTKCRSKPPPALLRIHLKSTQENVIPHELSTVIEVDSPMSMKLKNQSSNIDSANQSKNLVESKKEEKFNIDVSRNECQINPVLRHSIGTGNDSDALTNIPTDSSDESKLRMMDLNQFNKIMLKPFISLREYAQEYSADDVFAKTEAVSEDKMAIEDVSSFHSDGSLPDVVAELLKRKLIAEPFKFDSASNVNSTSVSSESTLSVLALSRGRKDDKNKQKRIENKENITETSDTLSISSNPDLENAFKKLGMGWASSTLKKTKERLALSSSSNTSSSSLSQFKFKNACKQDMPSIVTDSVSSVPNLPMKTVIERYSDNPRNGEKQTPLINSMTVKEFLTKELAKKITFTNKSDRNETNEEFVSLLETKMPEELKDSCQTMIENNSADSAPSGNNNRARTSTPVQIFKTVTYQSSSSSNLSNGLFSNADDLSSVKLTSNSMRYHSTSEKDELTVPNYSLKMRKGLSDCSKTDSY